jgi:hypothetical protein
VSSVQFLHALRGEAFAVHVSSSPLQNLHQHKNRQRHSHHHTRNDLQSHGCYSGK